RQRRHARIPHAKHTTLSQSFASHFFRTRQTRTKQKTRRVFRYKKRKRFTRRYKKRWTLRKKRRRRRRRRRVRKHPRTWRFNIKRAIELP
ncbi:MAG: hypothetical protein AAGJ35_11450, partial [Myxococcota bacterium]